MSQSIIQFFTKSPVFVFLSKSAILLCLSRGSEVGDKGGLCEELTFLRNLLIANLEFQGGLGGKLEREKES